MSEEPTKLANEIGVEFSGILVQSRGDDMQVLADMLADGSLKANVYLEAMPSGDLSFP